MPHHKGAARAAQSVVANVTSPREFPSLRQRLVFLIIYAGGLYVVSRAATGSWRPTGGGEWLWWTSGIALYVVSTLSAPFFVRPRDCLANAIVSAAMLLSVDLAPVGRLRQNLEFFRWASLSLVCLTGALAIAAITLHGASRSRKTWRERVSRLSYQFAVPLGREEVMFTPPALISIVGFYQARPMTLLWLAAFWIVIVTVKPVELLIHAWGILRQIRTTLPVPESVGHVIRVDDPNIIRVTLKSRESWMPDILHAVRLPGDRHVDVIPLFVQTQDEQLIGTGLCVDSGVAGTQPEAEVWVGSGEGKMGDVIQRLTGDAGAADLIGFVVEESSISHVRFEVALAHPLEEGTVVFVRERDRTVYYQCLGAVTREELFTQNPRGTQIAIAGQLGTLDEERGFRKYGWVPPMNAPVFLPRAAAATHLAGRAREADDFVLGAVAQTGLLIKASLSDMLRYHTALLGITGSGKTEMALDIIRAHLSAGRKVVCVDFTGEYKARLKDQGPVDLGFGADRERELDDLVNAIEYGQYKSEAEKRALDEWITRARPEVEKQAAEFIRPEGGGVGIFELPEIANTRATLRATELYLSGVFSWARQNRRAREIVIVLEEAHTVIPETVMFGFDKGETQAVVSRMAQIALQGRKYGVGLLLVSQRTALVSKTLLSQCNTCICFTMYDKTGLEYLSSVFSSEHARAIPNLRFLQAIAFGKAVKSDRPVVFEIREDPRKREASEALGRAPDPPAATMSPSQQSASPAQPSAAEDDDDIVF